MYFLYELMGIIFIIFSPLIIILRIISGKEDPKRFKEKFCFFPSNLKNRETIWIHGASVGEILSIVPVIKKLEKEKKIKKILITSSTTSSSLVFSKFKFKKTIHQFFPIDINYFTNKFIKHWQPKLAIFVDSEIWPNMYKNLNKKKIPIILLNARITKKTFLRWKQFPKFSKKIFNKINLALPQNLETLNFLKKLGVKNIKFVGNIKYYGENKKKIINKKLEKKFINRNLWCAASTHKTEEILIGKLHKKIKVIKKNLLTVIIPRHINRKDEILEELNKIGLKTALHSSFEKVKKDTDIYLVDTYGEASKFYGLTNVAFLGGSFIQHGGQNPLEPAREGNYILYGPNINNFREVYKMLDNFGIASKVNNIKKMENIIIKKINYKQTTIVNNKLSSMGNKILNNNINEIKKYI